jgi:hypothetical protein
MIRLLFAKLIAMVRRGHVEAGLDEEIQAHLEMARAEYMSQGMTLDAARRAALQSFGGVDQVRERHRETRGLPWLDELVRDLRLAASDAIGPIRPTARTDPLRRERS